MRRKEERNKQGQTDNKEKQQSLYMNLTLWFSAAILLIIVLMDKQLY